MPLAEFQLGLEYGLIRCPMLCVHRDWIVHCHGQANQTQLKTEIQINLLISDSLPHFPAPAINWVIASSGTALLALES
jgi:hypothetical protein